MTYLSDIPDDKAKEIGNQTFGPQDVAAMRALLNDPNVSAELRNNILYGLSAMGKVSDEEIEKYAPQVGADPEDVKGGGQAPGESVANLSKAFPVARGRQAVRSASGALQQGGFANSDQIIDEAAQGLRIFDNFFPIFQQAGGQIDPAASAPAGPVVTTPGMEAGGRAGATYPHTAVDPQTLRSGIDEFRGIDFAVFRADAQMLVDAQAAAVQVAENLDKAWRSNTADWAGGAKEAAEQRNNALEEGAGVLAETMSSASENVTYTINDGVEKNVLDFAKCVLGAYGDGKLADMSINEALGAIQTRDQIPSRIQEADAMIRELDNLGILGDVGEFMDGTGGRVVMTVLTAGMAGPYLFADLVGIELVEIRPGNVREERQKMQQLLDEANAKLQQLCVDYTTRASSIHEQAKTYIDAIQQCYGNLIQSLGKGLEVGPFAAVNQSAATSAGPMGLLARTGNGGTGGVRAGESFTPPAPAPITPAMPAPEVAQPFEPPVIDAAVNPVTGMPLELDPETGDPYAIDPLTGEAVTDAGDERETLTVIRGETELSLTEPDSEGRMDISIDGGSGVPQDYQLDFGEVNAAGEAVGVGEAAEPEPGGGEPQPGRPTTTEGEVHRPGPDGKIHIEDGDLEITAERPEGPDGPTVITVDDGSGETATYTLGEQGAEPEPTTATMAGQAAVTPATAGVREAAAVGRPEPDQGEIDGGPEARETAANTTQAAERSVTPVQAGAPDAVRDVVTDTIGTETAGGPTPPPSGTSTTVPSATPADLGVSFGEEPAADGGASSAGQPNGPREAQPAAGLGTAPGGQPAGTDAMGAGGMGMMGGGMGGAGGGGGGGGDQERNGSAYRIGGDLFEVADGAARISGTLDEDAERAIRFER